MSGALKSGDIAEVASSEPQSPPGPAQSCKPKFNVRFTLKNRWGDPFEGNCWHLELNGQEFQGVTGGDGLVSVEVDEEEGSGTLKTWLAIKGSTDGECREFPVQYGSLEPESSPEGVQQRLSNLGLYSGGQDGDIGEKSTRALRRFQARASLLSDGSVEGETPSKLKGGNEGS